MDWKKSRPTPAEFAAQAMTEEQMASFHVMPLCQALSILSHVHTRDDDLAGFVVEMGASASPFERYTQTEYLEAWKAVRHAAGLPVATAHEMEKRANAP